MGFQLKNKFQKFLVPFLFIILILFPSFISVKSSDIGSVFLSENYKEFNCIINGLWHEARGEPEAGIRAVMSVIYNRRLHKDYPDSFCGVILQRNQFSAFDNNKGLATEALKPLGSKDKKAYDVVSYVAHQAILGAFKPVLERDVLWYTNVSVKNRWTEKFTRVKVIHRHVFYKEI